ncbi:helix-turn-helix domain-containing protein [Photobacterium japonica]|uniref:GlxA family transcriptional regulator n=1 Tax=Photobacterium japonica TaxID=2910235 RepID=UPI003D14A23E
MTVSLTSTAASALTSSVQPDVRFLLLPMPQFNLLPLGGFLDKLRFSADEEDHSQQKYCSWTIAGEKAGALLSSSGVTIDVPAGLDEVTLEHYDYVVVFGGRSAQACIAQAPTYKAFLRRAAAKGLTLVSVDNATFLFAALGLLQQRKVAVHWRHVPEFEQAFPDVTVQPEQLFCIDGKRISCVGGAATIELAVALVSRHCGYNKAVKGLADMLVDTVRPSQHAIQSFDDVMAARSDSSRHVQRAIVLMHHYLHQKQTAAQLAAELGVCRRQLDRLFMTEFSITVSQYWLAMRMDHARWRLRHSSHRLNDIAEEVGFSDVNYFCKVFKQQVGFTPRQYIADYSK